MRNDPGSAGHRSARAPRCTASGKSIKAAIGSSVPSQKSHMRLPCPLQGRDKEKCAYRAIVGSRPQRTVHGQRHTSQACSPSVTEKKITCARPMRFSNGT
jgi:hypothetical protein